jgi:acetylglutamate kinase
MVDTMVIKIGGHDIDDPAFLERLALYVNSISRPVVIVHGGGKEVSDLQSRMGITPQYVAGVRVTDRESLDLVEMVLCGSVNKRLVRLLVEQGVDAQGMSGVDRGLIRAEKMPNDSVDMGFTGQVHSVRGEVLREMLAQGVTPVIAPICMGDDSNYNVNADHVAGAVAAAVTAERLVFLSNVEGVLLEGSVLLVLTPARAKRMIADGYISDGMIPKVNMAVDVLRQGVSRAVITDLAGLSTHGGTVFLPQSLAQ